MCGIIGYIGKKSPKEILIKGLKELEYRGYDSWGIAYREDKKEIKVYKKIGEIGKEKISKIRTLDFFSIGIGHTRWATHGIVSIKNTHPHFSNSKKIILVHNGIVENYRELKSFLRKKGYRFYSDTDSEVIANLLEYFYFRHKDIKKAVKYTFVKIKGRNAVVFILKDENILVGVRQGSPLITGINSQLKEIFIASDITAFTEYTSKVKYLDDGEFVVISKEKFPKIEFFNLLTQKKVYKRMIDVGMSKEKEAKGRFKHFMIKEIMEQKYTLKNAINQEEKELFRIISAIKKAKGSFLIGAGTAGKVCLLGEYFFSLIAKRHINFVIASEFKNYSNFLIPQSLVIAVSQSGETADVLEAVNLAKKRKAKVISIVNVRSSTLANISDYALFIKAGPEKAVASTKATTAQMAILALLAYGISGKLEEGKRALINLASEVNDMLNPRYEKHIKKIVKFLKNKEHIYIIGRGINYPIALESAIKIQEVSYIHAQGFAGGELKHGPLALIEKDSPVITLVSEDEVKRDILSNAKEAKSRGGFIIGISPKKEEIFDFWIRVPNTMPLLSSIVNLIPVQILAYHLAISKGINPDKPRNLAKSVTVK